MRDPTLHYADCLDAMRAMEPESVTAIVTDPPYGLQFMGKNWDHGIPGVPFWEAALRVAKPGAMLLAFGGTRTHHRLMAAIEDAGWEIRDCVMWVYGSGFPKSHSIGKAIDKAAGAERKVVGRESRLVNPRAMSPDGSGKRSCDPGLITAPATPAAQLWEGYGTALKPAVEICVVAMKPLAGTFAANALEHGVAGINVDGCRVDFVNESDKGDPNRFKTAWSSKGSNEGWRREAHKDYSTVPVGSKGGRWPANLIWSHVPDTDCPACSGDYPTCKLCGGTGVIQGCVRRGVKRVKGSNDPRKADGTRSQLCHEGYDRPWKHEDQREEEHVGYADADGLETVEDWDCHPDCPSRAFPESKSCNSPSRAKPKSKYRPGQGNYQPQGTIYPGDSGSASRFFQCCNYGEADRICYSPKASKRERTMGGRVECNHPCVKPLALMQYLVRLVTMPENTIILDPFMGSGTTGLACVAEGVEFIGIEKDPESFATAKGRIEAAQAEAKERLFA